jgi:hypothetical protein
MPIFGRRTFAKVRRPMENQTSFLSELIIECLDKII